MYSIENLDRRKLMYYDGRISCDMLYFLTDLGGKRCVEWLKIKE